MKNKKEEFHKQLLHNFWFKGGSGVPENSNLLELNCSLLNDCNLEWLEVVGRICDDYYTLVFNRVWWDIRLVRREYIKFSFNLVPTKDKGNKYYTPRVIVHIYPKNKKLYFMCGRSISKSQYDKYVKQYLK